MRHLAEFVMRGRPHAIGVSTVTAALPLLQWLSTAVVSLVVLRKGPVEGALVLLWAMLPTLALYYVFPDPTSAIGLIGTAVLAYVLRTTMSWEFTLGVALLVGAVAGWVLELTGAELVAALLKLYVGLNQQIAEQMSAMSEAALRSQVVGLLAMGQTLAMIGLLVLARWWQSVLYNPGAFRKEFHGLRLSSGLSLGIVVAIVLCYASDLVTFSRWIPLLTIPLAISGLSFVHWMMARRKLGGSWVFAFYLLLLLLMQFVYPMLAMLSVMDTWLNLRARLGASQSGGTGE